LSHSFTETDWQKVHLNHLVTKLHSQNIADLLQFCWISYFYFLMSEESLELFNNVIKAQRRDYNKEKHI